MSYRSSSSRLGGIGLGLGALIVAALLVLAIGFYAVNFYKTDSVTVTIKQKESINTQEGHEYRVYTDQGTFVMKDTLIKGRFDTADEYAKLDEGQRYNCDKFGFRVPLFSSFENLINCHKA